MPSTSSPEAVSEPHLSPNPLGDAAASEDQVGLAVRSIATTILFEVAWLALVGWGTAAISLSRGITAPEQLAPGDPQVNLVVWGTLGAVFIGAMITWFLLAPVRSNYRRGGLAMVGGIAGLVVGGILTFLVSAMMGQNALIPLSVLMAITTVMMGRAARRAVQALPSSQHR